MSAIAAVLRDNCLLKSGDESICPNIYVLLLAKSAVYRKGRPVKLVESLVQKIGNTKVISGRSSIQAILDELSRGETDKNGKITAGGSALFSAQELAAGIVSDPDAVKILTDIYDFREEYTSRLKGSGRFQIKNICFTMLAASNEDLLKDLYDEKAKKGGLLGRTFLIVPDQFREGKSLLEETDTKESYRNLENKLREISLLKGIFKIETDAKKEYDGWYIPFRESYKDARDDSGILGRIHTGVLKIAMILCANETLSLHIHQRHIEQAIQMCLELIPNYNAFLMSGGKSSIAETGTIVLQELYNAKDHIISRKELLRKHWNDFDAETLDKLTVTLVAAEMLKDVMTNDGIFFSLTKKCLETLFGGKK